MTSHHVMQKYNYHTNSYYSRSSLATKVKLFGRILTDLLI